MESRALTEEETEQGHQLMLDLTATVISSTLENDITSLGVVVTALSSVLLSHISMSVEPHDWEATIDLIFSNLKTVVRARVEQLNARCN